MFVSAMLCLCLAQVREDDLACEALADGLKVTGRYTNVGAESVTPKIQLLIIGSGGKLLGSGIANLEPRTLKPGKSSTLTGLSVSLPKGAVAYKVVMSTEDGEIDIEGGGHRTIKPMAELVEEMFQDQKREVEVNLPIEKRKEIYLDYGRAVTKSQLSMRKVSKKSPRYNERHKQVWSSLYEGIQKKHGISSDVILKIVDEGFKNDWPTSPEGKAFLGQVEHPTDKKK